MRQKKNQQLSPEKQMERIQDMRHTMIACINHKLQKMTISQLQEMIQASYDVLNHGQRSK